MQETPPRGDIFTIDGWRLSGDETTVLFSYSCDVYGTFEEKVTFPGPDGALADLAASEGKGLLDLLAVALGVSTYKLAAARTLKLPPLTAGGAAVAKALYTEGLAEFYVRNGLPYPADLKISAAAILSELHGAPPETGPALVAFGGGKDSYVARQIILAAGDKVQLTSIVLGDAVRDALTATAPDEVLFINRQLDPKLYEIAPRAFGGHVPITAINMLVLAITAVLNGQTQVIFANERSADEPTIELADGMTANHQYSKSSNFEGLIRTALAEVHIAPPSVYSILRPYSELWIGQTFARIEDAFGRFTSCNRNFRLAGDAEKRWCGECAKCAFTSLILAPFITAEEAKQIFGEVFLDCDALQPLYEQLLGLSDQKPWDCVGTIDECRAALWRAAKNDAFKRTAAVENFLPRLRSEVTEDEFAKAWDAAMVPHQSHVVPDIYLNAAENLA